MKGGENLAKLVCPVEGCGKEYDKDTMDEALRSMQAHLTGMHCLKGDAYRKAMERVRDEYRDRKRSSKLDIGEYRCKVCGKLLKECGGRHATL